LSVVPRCRLGTSALELVLVPQVWRLAVEQLEQPVKQQMPAVEVVVVGLMDRAQKSAQERQQARTGRTTGPVDPRAVVQVLLAGRPDRALDSEAAQVEAAQVVVRWLVVGRVWPPAAAQRRREQAGPVAPT
jgi:hypothetical protein